MAARSAFGKATSAETVTAAFASQVRGRVFLITGVNSKGLGGATARALATQGPKLLILTGRGPEKVNEVIAEVRAIDPAVSCRFLQVDLASLASVRRAAAEALAFPEAIDAVINNAGVMALPRRSLNEDGVELQLASNHVGHFLLTNLLAPKLLAAAASSPAGATRVVNVSSFGHQFGGVRFSDLAFTKRSADLPEGERVNDALYERIGARSQEGTDPEALGYDPFAAYGQSKSANVLFALALNRRLAAKGVRAFSLHPGSIFTELSRHADEEWLAGIRNNAALPRKDLSAGASTQLVAALDLDLEADGKHIYLDDCQLKDASPWAVDEEAAERLWKLSEELVGQKFAY
jgi:NAD(P)-dependent dehydrogenase (short-subunit alcohol dehydrogenase family)